MAPTAVKRTTRSSQPPLAIRLPVDQIQALPRLEEIFNTAQHVATTDSALAQLKKFYKMTDFKNFEKPLQDCVRKLFQAKPTGYFKTTCDFLCKFLQHVSMLSEGQRDNVTVENTAPTSKTSRRVTRSSAGSDSSMTSVVASTGNRRGKRKAVDLEDDELVSGFLECDSQNDQSASEDSLIGDTTRKRRKSVNSSRVSVGMVTDHDRTISSCIDVANEYMQVVDDCCRLNAVIFIGKFLTLMKSLDEGILSILKTTLVKRIRDRKPMIRAQAVWASAKFQSDKMIREGFKHHFYRDPELVVRSALLQTMDTNIFGYDFLVYSTRDPHESIRKTAFKRLGNVDLTKLNQNQLHHIIHNGLSERERGASYCFKTHALLKLLELYDGLDIYKLLEHLDVIKYTEDICRLLEVIFERNLEELQNNGTSTKLHHVVESFREKWLTDNSKCLPSLESLDERVVIIWFTLIKFCKTHQLNIKPVKVRQVQQQDNSLNESIEKIIDLQELNEEIVDLYERLTPDLVNVVGLLERFIPHADNVIKKKLGDAVELEFIYQQMMQFISTYNVSDESESSVVEEVFDIILRENLLTSKFNNFIPPVVECLFNLIYESNSYLLINYISEIIQDVRSNLDDNNESHNSFVFKHYRNDLLKCLQMYYGCLKSVKITNVPQTMLSHLCHLNMESLAEWFRGDDKLRSLMVACTGLTAFLDKEFAKQPTTQVLLTCACHDPSSVEVKKAGFISVVDMICEHDDIALDNFDKVERFLNSTLRDYDKYTSEDITKSEVDFITAIVEGTSKLYFHKKISSPQILSHLIIWWYHPSTHSRSKQLIGVFLPLFVDHASRKHRSAEDTWLEELLGETFVTSIEYLHNYSRTMIGYEIMASSDMHSLINFLCNLIPVTFNSSIMTKVNQKIEDLAESPDLLKFMKQARNNLASTISNNTTAINNQY